MHCNALALSTFSCLRKPQSSVALLRCCGLPLRPGRPSRCPGPCPCPSLSFALCLAPLPSPLRAALLGGKLRRRTRRRHQIFHLPAASWGEGIVRGNNEIQSTRPAHRCHTTPSPRAPPSPGRGKTSSACSRRHRSNSHRCAWFKDLLGVGVVT